MTCFAAVLDPNAREISFVSCGHTTPYLVPDLTVRSSFRHWSGEETLSVRFGGRSLRSFAKTNASR